jgi:hypothetical protein
MRIQGISDSSRVIGKRPSHNGKVPFRKVNCRVGCRGGLAPTTPTTEGTALRPRMGWRREGNGSAKTAPYILQTMNLTELTRNFQVPPFNFFTWPCNQRCAGEDSLQVKSVQPKEFRLRGKSGEAGRDLDLMKLVAFEKFTVPCPIAAPEIAARETISRSLFISSRFR